MTRLVLALLCSLPVACKAHVPASDDTPPEVVLRYRLDDGPWTALPAPKTIYPAFDQTLHVWVSGTDGDGVRSVEVRARGTLLCSSGPHGEVDLHEDSTSDAGVGDEVPETLHVSGSLDLSEICSAGSPTGAFTVSGRAENFHGGAGSTPVLTVATP